MEHIAHSRQESPYGSERLSGRYLLPGKLLNARMKIAMLAKSPNDKAARDSPGFQLGPQIGAIVNVLETPMLSYVHAIHALI